MPVPQLVLVHARTRQAPRDTVRALNTGRGRHSSLRGLGLKQSTATLSRIPSLTLYTRWRTGVPNIQAISQREVTKQQYYIYIMTNPTNTTLYTGVTSDLIKRVYEHREKSVDGFTKRYNLSKLVYYEVFDDVEQAILREKQIKGGSREKKLQLINERNKAWKDLYEDL